MSEDEIKALVREEVAKAVHSKVYTSLDELPWGQEKVQRLLDAGILQRGAHGGINLTDETLRTVSMVDRLLLELQD